VLLGHDVIADRKAKPGALAGRLGREEGLEQLVLDLRAMRSRCPDCDLYSIAEIRVDTFRVGWNLGSLPSFRRLVAA